MCHGAGSCQYAGLAAGLCRAGRAVGTRVLAAARDLPPHIWSDRSRHQQLPAADRASDRRGFTVIDAFSRIVRLGEGLSLSGALRRMRWIGRSERCRCARTNCGGAMSRCRARSRPRRAAAPPTAPSSPSASATETGIVLDIIEPAGRSASRRPRLPQAARARRRAGADLRHRRRIDRAGAGRPGRRRPQDPRLVERALGRGLADRKRRPRGARRSGPDQGLQADARTGSPFLHALRRRCFPPSATESACSAPAARSRPWPACISRCRPTIAAPSMASMSRSRRCRRSAR